LKVIVKSMFSFALRNIGKDLKKLNLLKSCVWLRGRRRKGRPASRGMRGCVPDVGQGAEWVSLQTNGCPVQ
jgi:hypothetical protein